MVDANRSKHIRKCIIEVLYKKHPEWVADDLLWICLKDLGCLVSAEQLASELVYLRDYPAKDNGYIELRPQWSSMMKGNVNMSRLTPRGVDLREGTIEPDSHIG